MTSTKAALRAEIAQGADRVAEAAARARASALRMQTAAQVAAQAVRDYARTTPLRPRLLIVDDDEPWLKAVQTALAPACDVEIATTGIEAIVICRRHYFDAILCDMILPCQIPGPALIAHLRTDHGSMHPQVPIIAISTSMEDPEFQLSAKKAGACAMLSKQTGYAINAWAAALRAELRRLGLMHEE